MTSYGLEELWVTAGLRDTSRYIPVHTLVIQLGVTLCQVLPAVHTLTGCDYTSKFRTKAAALKANPKMYLKDFGTMESDIENQVTLAEHYLLQVRKKGSFCRTSDELKNYFYHHVKSPDLPPTSQETRLHILRAFFATNQKKSCIYEGFDWCLGYSLF